MERRRLTPRKYDMGKRSAAVEETRKRIVEATLALHAEKGAFGTSWQDIAHRADVSVGTVYKHFPSLDELVPACGELVFAISRPPSLEDAPQIFAGASSLEERLGRLVSEFFDFYERGEPYLDIDFQERKLPAVQEWLAHMRATREGFAREALHPLEPEERTVRAMGALLDFPLFKSFRLHDVPKAEAEEIVNSVLLCWIGGTPDGH
jgi:AcrR family transcriptional regulator